MFKKRKFKLFIFVCGIFICMLDTTVMNVALPEIGGTFSTALNNLSWALNIYTILFASLTIPFTRVAERYGMNKTIMLGFVIFGIGSLVSGISNGLGIIVFGRAIQSIGAALVFPLSMTLGINLVDKDKRTGVIAILGVTQGLAAALGSVIGGIITQYLTWRWIFFINLPIVILVLIIGFKLLSFNEENEKVSDFDIFGATFSILFLLSLTTVLTQGRSWGWTSLLSLLVILCSLVFFASFLVVEFKSTNPMISLDLFKDKNFIGSSVVIVLSNLFLVGITVLLPTFYTNVRQYDALHASFMIVPVTLFIFIASPISGFALKKVGPKILLSFGFLLMVIGYIGYANNGLNNQLYSCIYGALIGAGYGLITGPITVIGAADFTGELLSASQSVSGVLRQIGIVLAVAIFVTDLYTNLKNAQVKSEQYVYGRVSKLNIPKQAKSTLLKKSLKGIRDQKTTSVAKKHTGNVEIDQYINEVIRDIKATSLKNIVTAFKSLYKATIPYLLVTLVSTFIFWKRKESK